MGLIMAIFIESGTIPDCRDSLMIRVMWLLSLGASKISSRMGIGSRELAHLVEVISFRIYVGEG